MIIRDNTTGDLCELIQYCTCWSIYDGHVYFEVIVQYEDGSVSLLSEDDITYSI